MDQSELRNAYNKPHIYIFFLPSTAPCISPFTSPFNSEHFRVDCRLPEQALHLVILLLRQQEVVICGEILLYAAVLSAKGETFCGGARSIKSLARHWEPVIRISLAVKDNVVILEASPGVSLLSVYTLLVN